MYKIGICDDDMGVCFQIEEELHRYAEARGIKIEVEVFSGGKELCRRLGEKKSQYHLLFLDIELGDMGGIEAGNFLRDILKNEATQVVFISYRQEYAMQLFRVRPLDFLIKPISYEKLESVMNTYLRLFPDKKLFFEYQKNRQSHQVAQHEILCIKCDGKKVRIVTSGEEIAFYGKMDDVYRQLEAGRFWTIHKSYIINVDYVFEFRRDEIELVNHDILPISKAYRKEIANRLLNRKLQGEI